MGRLRPGRLKEFFSNPEKCPEISSFHKISRTVLGLT
jgi:hypothetical protein